MSRPDINVVIDEDAHDAAAIPALDEEIDADESPAHGLPRGTRQGPNGTVILPLSAPVTIRTKKDGKISEHVYHELTFRRFTGQDLRAIRQLTGDAQTIEMFSRATSTQNARMSALYDRMDAADIRRAGEVIEYFFENGPTTGR
jgi:hypothetical protein